MMKIELDSIIKYGYLDDKYGKHAADEFKKDGVPFVNFPFKVSNIDNKYKYISWYFIDHDAYEVCNFSWMHWQVANVVVSEGSVDVPENLINSSLNYVGGINSYASPLSKNENEDIIFGYGGPMPPNRDHNYSLVVIAHDQRLDLNKGYFYNIFLDELEKVDKEEVSIKILSRV